MSQGICFMSLLGHKTNVMMCQVTAHVENNWEIVLFLPFLSAKSIFVTKKIASMIGDESKCLKLSSNHTKRLFFLALDVKIDVNFKQMRENFWSLWQQMLVVDPLYTIVQAE